MDDNEEDKMRVVEEAVEQALRKRENHGNTKNYDYYKKLRRENPREYFKASTQNQMVRDRQRLGREGFFGGSK